jgi:purine-binding chemotaxis protein CheW
MSSRRGAAAEQMNGSTGKDENGHELALLCRIGTCFCALPLHHVRETMRPLPTSPLGGAPAFVRGVAVIRGAPVPVVDAARLLGAHNASDAGRYVTLRSGERTVALAVEGVEGVSTLRELDIGELPPLLREASEATVSAIGTLDAELLLVLESAHIVPASVWSRLDQEAAPA